MRRQIFIAVCDDLILRDRLATHLQAEVNQATSVQMQPSETVQTTVQGKQHRTTNSHASTACQTYPSLVSLQLSLDDPNPLIQVAQWLTQSPPPVMGGYRAPMPAFQILGVEHLTRQSPAIQRLFFTHLQSIERNLPLLDFSLLIWTTQPWFYALSESAPEFWRCRTGVFEFVGDPTPISVTSPERFDAQTFEQFERDQVKRASPGRSAKEYAGIPSLSLTFEGDQFLGNQFLDDQFLDDQPSVASVEPDLAETNLTEPEQPGTAFYEPEMALGWEEDSADVTEEHAPLTVFEDMLGASWWEPEETGEDTSSLATNHSLETDHSNHSDLFSGQLADLVSKDLHSDGWFFEEQISEEQIPEERSPYPTGYVQNRDQNHDQNDDQNTEWTLVRAEEDQISVSIEQPQATSTHPAFQERTSSPAEINAAEIPPLQLPEEVLAQDEELRLMLQQLELLHRQQTPASVMATAYRTVGDFFRDRIEQGEVSPQNLTIAIQAYEYVLLFLPDSPSAGVDILNDLGNLYWMTSRTVAHAGEAVSCLQQGVHAYQHALTKVTADNKTQTYPMIQNNLGAAYADLARYQEPAQNLELSVQSYREALAYRQPNIDPQRYASTQNNLGTTYWNLAQYKETQANLKQAIAAYSEALRYYNPSQEPLNYAMIQNNLGTAYWNLAQHEQPQEWLKQAVSAYQKALTYRTLDVAPAAYAATQNNLGTAYWHIADHADDPTERLKVLEHAIEAYKAALHAVDLLQKHQPHVELLLNFDRFATHNNLGLAHYQLATDALNGLNTTQKSHHLHAAIEHHVGAWHGWQQKPDLQQTAFSCIVQAIRAAYTHLGTAEQNLALSKVPGQLLPDILPKL